jgi:hypothetical protein
LYDRIERKLAGIVSLWLAGAAAVYLLTARSYVDGVDLYVFVCHARDMLQGTAPETDSAYRYFPGIYSFWKMVLFVGGTEISAVQWGVVSAIASNAVLVGLFCRKVSTSHVWAAYGAALYVSIASRYECLAGTGEPIATIFFLAGLLCLDSRAPFSEGLSLRRLFLPVCLGLCVYTKQQAGFLTIGMMWLPIAGLCKSDRSLRRFRSDLGRLAETATIAVIVFLIAVLFEGKGLSPVRDGLAMATGYSAEGNLLTNIWDAIRNDETAGLVAFVGVVGAALKLLRSSESSVVLGILVCAGLFTLLQFSKRGYYHYFLLATPCFVIAFVDALSTLRQQRQKSVLMDRSFRLGTCFLAAVPLFYCGERELDFMPLTPVVSLPAGSASPPWHADPLIRNDLSEVRKIVSPGSRIGVLPPVRSVIYFLLGSRQEAGYAFGNIDSRARVNSENTDFVVVLKDMDSRESSNWKETECDSAILRMKKIGFLPTGDFQRMTVWSRPGAVQ